ncbi:hypothetical protein N0B44_03935 [Roseibacterium beibuensis]|uniref:Uncharacterized protein n=1 Tax=[Roseibacterium] beibuensis TaxID=1193142 RepID=A0ABP9KXM0_9RHOB|nr:hypothetical protein [Roseibacterium beibuensis]MCS6622058.1 hypothetical protein [Roseibacterium beibuensis]
MIIAHDDMMRRAGIEGPVASLKAFLQGTRAPMRATMSRPMIPPAQNEASRTGPSGCTSSITSR